MFLFLRWDTLVSWRVRTRHERRAFATLPKMRLLWRKPRQWGQMTVFQTAWESESLGGINLKGLIFMADFSWYMSPHSIDFYGKYYR